MDPETGKKRYYPEVVKGTKAQAERRMTELLRQIDTGSLALPRKITVGEHLEQWLRDYAEAHVRTRTLEGYRGNLDRYILPKLGGIPLEKLTPRHVQEMESALLRGGGRKGNGLSPRTVLQVHRILSSALKNAVELGMTSRNVAEVVKPPRITRYEARSLSWAEIRRLLGSIADPLYQTLVLLGLQTGLRRSELLGLQWRDVDLSAGTLAVQRAWIKLPSGRMEGASPKSGRARVVVLPERSVEVLGAYRAGFRGSSEDRGFVFCRPDGTPLDPDLVTQGFKRLARKAGFDDLRLHDLRHTHASLLLAEGVHLKVTSERLGHSDISITGNLYSHVQATVQREAVERFGDAWSTGMSNGMSIPGNEC